jgi:hypothetical protein
MKTNCIRQKKMVMSELVEFLSLSNPLELCSDHFPNWLYQQGGIYKDPTVWIDGASPPQKHIFKNNMNLANSKIWPTQTLQRNSISML